ncbi:hypothetical protein [Burkholderia ubonensis]|uniref:Uncharacterized protein n=1 Tax=Burkholderia ubonensis subsp. mesacidophila TaxID=265293 RepID=A0A2A4F880_9BURK|nr:hypothetical protein [Burkholderia ubonensis]PCE30053.1 hypothetical protein BZL54_23090 [Burkholderia ubonensis subsp. mesacidophila]
MPADKIGRFLSSDAAQALVSAAVKKAIRNLEEHGIKPTYIVRKPKEAATNVEAGGDVKVTADVTETKRK